ncbi:HAD family hydrolase [Nocardioides nematodiphilus]|uniref:HAD family hydrolase n=1 Tax=Nocardioides nematodiphilus TaxID=2849669 RepID=UPI001CD9CE1E|nr:HAD family hydrolase [Nocardioides nematodiphilus]MCA1984339.1 Cof-type HAD-IIB family hydrolase [Nocardioides nematodiphilus]
MVRTTARLPDTGWIPKVIALDIDGTLLKWEEGTGASSEVMSAAVIEAVGRAYDAGAYIVLASGRSPHGMTKIADMLGLPREADERLWIVASNGAVVLRYPPLDVVHEELFDAGPAVRAILAEQPSALVAVEERGVGYKLNDHFPPGELTGTMTLAAVEDLIKDPVSRVIIRNPEASAEDFLEMGRRLGLQGISYVVGWTAWLDLMPIGVSKASGLAHVVTQLGLEPQDCLAIGDGRNDLEMFDWVGRAVAMGQAVTDVREAADAVTLPVDQDGAAVEISRWF